METKNKKEVKQAKAVKSTNKLFLALQSHPEADRTIKNKNKFSGDKVVLRAYETVKDVIAQHKFTPDNVFAHMADTYAKTPLDCQKKDIKRPQRVLAAMCCKASGQSRSTSSFAQDLKHIGNTRNRQTILQAFPSISETVLQTIFKATFLPSRTK